MRYKNKTVLSHGFTLPVVVLASVVMLMVMASAGALLAANISSLDGQYYDSIAQEATQAGVVHAQSCIFSAGAGSATWSNSSQLRPNSSCDGGSQCSSEDCYVVSKPDLHSTYSVGSPSVDPNGTTTVKVEGVVQLLRRSNSSVWREYSYTQYAVVRSTTTPQIASGAGWKTKGHNGYMLSGEGVLWGWGDNDSQQLGPSGMGSTIENPIRISLPSGMNYVKKFVGSGQGASFLCALMVSQNAAISDEVHCRGTGGLGMASTGDWVKFTLPDSIVQHPVDMAVHGYGKDSACVLTNIGNVYCVGINESGQMGLRNTSDTFVPLTSAANKFLMPGSVKAKEIFTQDRLTCAIGTDNKAYCAGDNALGQLGRGNITTNVWIGNSNPERVQIPGNPNVKTVRLVYHGGSFASYFLSSVGDVYMSGAAWSGTANDGTTTNRYSTPRKLTSGSFGDMISTGQEGSANLGGLCAISSSVSGSNSGMWCAGANKFGQVGSGTCSSAIVSKWSSVKLPSGAGRVSPDMGPVSNYQMNSVMVIDRKGVAYAAGDNTYGKLGTGAALGGCNSTFKKVKMPSGVKAVAVANADEYTAFILGDDDNLYAMGRNNQGQLGNGTTTDSRVPVKVQIPREFNVYY